MAVRPLIVVLHNAVGADAKEDERDVLVQADAVEQALRELGYRSERLETTLDLQATAQALRRLAPARVFNLVESLDGDGRLASLVPALLDGLGLPYTGAAAESMFVTSGKLLTKQRLAGHGIESPAWWVPGRDVDPAGPWIVKSVWEDASLGLDDDAVVADLAAASELMIRQRTRWGGEWFAERFVEGREFNVALLGPADRPTVLPIAEICFAGYPPAKPRLVGYRAKWQTDSFEYRQTIRRFETAPPGAAQARLPAIARRCWEVLGLRDYARIDFRVDESGRPWVLEANANPCLSPDAGFAAALGAAGIPFADAIGRIVADGRDSTAGGGHR